MHVCMLSCVRPECFVHEIFQSRILEWITISSSRVSSQPRDQTHITFLSCSCRWILTTEPFGKPTILYTWNQYDILNQFSSIAQSCPTLWDPMDCSTPGLPVHHQLPEFTQTHVHWVSDAIQLSSPSPPAFSLFQHQGLFKWVSSLHQVAKVLEFQLQHVLPMNIQDWFPLGWTGLISLLSKGLSRVFSNTTV